MTTQGLPGSAVKTPEMGDLQDPRLMYLKAALFLVAGTLSGVALLLESLTLERAFLLFIMVWSFCRLYYFMFYVIEKYIDDGYRFAGIGSFLKYLWSRRNSKERDNIGMGNS